MRGAIKAHFNVLFVFKASDAPMGIFNLRKVEKEKFGKTEEIAEEFVKEHGMKWFFCKCKKERMTHCMDMITGASKL